MKNNPNYESYSLEELYDALSHIDRERFPNRVIAIREEIGKRTDVTSESPKRKSSKIVKFDSGLFGDVKGWEKAILSMPAIFLLLALLIMNYVPAFKGKNPFISLYETPFAHQVDSVVIGYRVHKILVDSVWYKLPANYYTTFAESVSKGDSVFKGPNRWDVKIRTYQEGQSDDFYFEGAQGYW